jgi:hypothetical protein
MSPNARVIDMTGLFRTRRETPRLTSCQVRQFVPDNICIAELLCRSGTDTIEQLLDQMPDQPGQTRLETAVQMYADHRLAA